MSIFCFLFLLSKQRLANLNFSNFWFQLLRDYNCRQFTRLLSMSDFQFEYLFSVRQVMQAFFYLLGQLKGVSKKFTFAIVFQYHLTIGVKFSSNLYSPVAFSVKLAFRVLVFNLRRYIFLSSGDFFQNFNCVILFRTLLRLLSKFLLCFFLCQFFDCFTNRVRKTRRDIFRFK